MKGPHCPSMEKMFHPREHCQQMNQGVPWQVASPKHHFVLFDQLALVKHVAWTTSSHVPAVFGRVHLVTRKGTFQKKQLRYLNSPVMIVWKKSTPGLRQDIRKLWRPWFFQLWWCSTKHNQLCIVAVQHRHNAKLRPEKIRLLEIVDFHR